MKLRPLLLTGVILCGLLIGISAWQAGSTGAQTMGDPLGNLSIDADPAGTTANTASSVGTIETTASVTDAPGGAGLTVELVIGDAGSTDGTPTGGIPDTKDIAGWAASIQFDPAVLTFKGFIVKNCTEELGGDPIIGYYMEKASNCDGLTDDHISVVTPPIADGGGEFDIGSTITGTPAGANGVGRIARLIFDAATTEAAGTCIHLLPLAGSAGSRNVDINEVVHPFASLQGAGIGLNGGAPPSNCLQAPTPTPSPTPSPGPADGTPTPTPTTTGGPGATGTPTSTPTSAPAGSLPGGGGEPPEGGGWLAPALIVAAGLALLASGGAVWRYYGKRNRRPAGGA